MREVLWGAGFRWCRFAQPPATGWHPSGMHWGCARGRARSRRPRRPSHLAPRPTLPVPPSPPRTPHPAPRTPHPAPRCPHPAPRCPHLRHPGPTASHGGTANTGWEWIPKLGPSDVAGTPPGCGTFFGVLDSGGVASLNHRLQADIPPGCTWRAPEDGRAPSVPRPSLPAPPPCPRRRHLTEAWRTRGGNGSQNSAHPTLLAPLRGAGGFVGCWIPVVSLRSTTGYMLASLRDALGGAPKDGRASSVPRPPLPASRSPLPAPRFPLPPPPFARVRHHADRPVL
jgi:hypothetical protein